MSLLAVYTPSELCTIDTGVSLYILNIYIILLFMQSYISFYIWNTSLPVVISNQTNSGCTPTSRYLIKIISADASQ